MLVDATPHADGPNVPGIRRIPQFREETRRLQAEIERLKQASRRERR
jgi:hypothetical protein